MQQRHTVAQGRSSTGGRVGGAWLEPGPLSPWKGRPSLQLALSRPSLMACASSAGVCTSTHLWHCESSTLVFELGVIWYTKAWGTNLMIRLRISSVRSKSGSMPSSFKTLLHLQQPVRLADLVTLL